MPAKAKRYRVLVLDPILNTWRVIATELKSPDATKLMGMVFWDTKKEECEDSDAER